MELLEQFECHMCYNTFKKFGINCNNKICDIDDVKKKIRALYLTHHPDKGGNPEIFDKIKKCADIIVGKECYKTIEQDCDPSFNIFKEGYTVKPKCVKGKIIDKQYSPNCDVGHIYKAGYTVKEKCTVIDDLSKMVQFKNKSLDKERNILIEFKKYYLGTMYHDEPEEWYIYKSYEKVDKYQGSNEIYLKKMYNNPNFLLCKMRNPLVKIPLRCKS